jgi:hypothetical protein
MLVVREAEVRNAQLAAWTYRAGKAMKQVLAVQFALSSRMALPNALVVPLFTGDNVRVKLLETSGATRWLDEMVRSVSGVQDSIQRRPAQCTVLPRLTPAAMKDCGLLPGLTRDDRGEIARIGTRYPDCPFLVMAVPELGAAFWSAPVAVAFTPRVSSDGSLLLPVARNTNLQRSDAAGVYPTVVTALIGHRGGSEVAYSEELPPAFERALPERVAGCRFTTGESPTRDYVDLHVRDYTQDVGVEHPGLAAATLFDLLYQMTARLEAA